MYQIEKNDEKIKIKCSTSFEMMEKICAEVENFSKKLKFYKKLFALLLCTREALTNSIRHGNKNDYNKTIYFCLQWKDNAMMVTIEDEGDGFDWTQEPGPADLLSVNGRGRNIIKIYSDEMSYNKIGNIINFIIKK